MNRSRLVAVFLPAFLAPVLLLTGCSNNDAALGVSVAPPQGVQVSFSGDVQPILATHGCATLGCHNSSALLAPMPLDPDKAYVNLVDVPSCEAPGLKRVNPGQSATSYLISKLTDDQSRVQSSGGCTAGCAGFTPPGSCGTRMPQPPLPALQDSEIAIIRDWIDQGAKDN